MTVVVNNKRYYETQKDLEHLGWIDLSECKVDPYVEQEPDAFNVDVPGRRYTLRAPRRDIKGQGVVCEFLRGWWGLKRGNGMVIRYVGQSFGVVEWYLSGRKACGITAE